MSAQAPNIVFLFADQLRYASCGFAGDTRARTPNLDRLAAEGVNFENATSVYPLCGPYRASLLCGKYPTSTGMFRNNVRVRPDPDAAGHVLTRAGFETGYIGKWHLYSRDHTEQFTPPGPYRLGFDGYWASYSWNHRYWDGFYYEDTPERLTMSGFAEDFQTDLALRFLEQRDPGKPFALFVSYETPHPPLSEANCPPEDYAAFRDVDFSDLLYAAEELPAMSEGALDAAWQRKHVLDVHQERCRAYYALTGRLDHNVGRLVDGLAQRGLSANTIVVFTSDHGDMLGAHGRIAKRIFFDESLRVPFVARWPGHIQAGVKLPDCLNTPDILPSLLDLAGIPVPRSVEGRSRAGAMLGRTCPPAGTDHAFVMSMTEGSKYNPGEEWRGIRDARYLYARMLRSGAEYLFDHREDPRELRNLAAEGHEMLGHFRELLERELRARNDVCALTLWYDRHWVADGCLAGSATGET